MRWNRELGELGERRLPRATPCARTRTAPRRAGAPAARACRRCRPASACLSRAGGAPRGLVAVWLPDALVGAGDPLWHKAFGLRLDDASLFASAGCHPAELTVAEGEFSPALIRRALLRSGYRAAGRTLMHGADGSVDPSTEAGRLSLSALNRVMASPTRVIAASTSDLLRAARSSSTRLAADRDFAAAADALDPITSAIVLDADLVQPPSGVPTRIITSFPARLVAVGIDDLGPSSRTIKIALVYESSDQARADAMLIERALPSTSLPGAQGTTFSDLACRPPRGRRYRLAPSERQPRNLAFACRAGRPRGARQTAGLICSQAQSARGQLARARAYDRLRRATPTGRTRFRTVRVLPSSPHCRRRSGARR
jgi:hypothetical protein